MQNRELKHNTNPVGASIVRPHNKGITLIALVITIIVMLILVGVTVTVALNGGLFTTAKQATGETQNHIDKEQTLAGGQIEVDGKTYASMDDYLNNEPIVKLPEGWSKTDKPEGWTSEKVTAVTDGTNIVPLPEGFEISTEEGENTVSGGLVIKDGANEFVWIPYTSATQYVENSFGPLEGTDSTSKCVLDSQDQLNYYYGTKEDGTPYFNYSDFNYVQDKTNIETSINKYKGFYVGRYETTIDESGNIGSMKNKPILTTDKTIAQTNNKKVRWYGLYKVEKDMYKDNEAVFSTMITSKEWDTIMNFTGYSSAARATSTYTTKPDLSGSAYKTDSSKYDVSKNIYDMAGNVEEWTLKASSTYSRVNRGR